MRANSESGFSLLELTVAALLTVGIMGAVMALTTRNQQVFVTESAVIDMNQNIRTVADLLTRDIQSSGVGLPVTYGNFASIFYINGAGGAPDSILMLNGDPFSPVASVDEKTSSKFTIFVPNDVTISGGNITYINRQGTAVPVYVNTAADPLKRKYIVYDEMHAEVFSLTANGVVIDGGSRIELTYDPSTSFNPPGTFGATVGTSLPNYENAKVAVLGSTLGYRLNTTTGELERTEDLVNWFPIARGIIDFQIQYRAILRNSIGVVEEKVTDTPGDGTDVTAGGTPTSRRDIRSVIVTVRAETPDLSPGDRGYRQVTHKFEVAPRNLNLVNNNNLSVDQ